MIETQYKIYTKKLFITKFLHIISSRGRNCMVVGFTTTYAICAYHYWCCEFESRSGRGVQHYVIKFVSDLWQVSGFLQVIQFPPPIKLRHDITELLLEVTLNTIKPYISFSRNFIGLKLDYVQFFEWDWIFARSRELDSIGICSC
jgi:hypothetical protein